MLPIVFIATLTTSYSDKVWNKLSRYVDLPFQARQVHYDFPYHFSLHQIELSSAPGSSINQIDIWFNPSLRANGKWIIDSLLVDGITLTSGMLKLKESEQTLSQWQQATFHQIALKNAHYNDGTFFIDNLNVQVQLPTWLEPHQIVPYGDIQLSAESLRWNGEKFDNLLLDLHYQPQNSTLYGTSFNWRDSLVSGQGEQYPQGWSLVNVTVDKLHLNQDQLSSLLDKPWQNWPIRLRDINSLDLLNADIQYGGWHFQHASLSLENASLPFSLWQSSANLSLQADSISFQDQIFINPHLQAQFQPNDINVEDLSFDWQQGQVNITGQIEPNQWQINSASINDVKWTIKPDNRLQWMHHLAQYTPLTKITHLSVKRSQVIQLAQAPFWQISGLNLTGNNLQIIPTPTLWEIWDGRLEASAVSASYDQYLSSHAALSTQSIDGLWQLEQLFLPLTQGYLKALGQVDLNTPSKPWTLQLDANGVPVEFFTTYLDTPGHFSGLSDLTVNLHGLAGDRQMLAYSLSGETTANFREATLILPTDGTSKTITLTPLKLEAQRGTLSLAPISVSGNDINGQISGKFDLASNPLSGLIYQIDTHCWHATGDLLSGEQQTTTRCQTNGSSDSSTEKENKLQQDKPSLTGTKD
ncbi:AsmA family protein [Vibrio sagamiensis NBRC 104589]|uniref:AsmA family protein n=1 Tax=Vibrio sagamiensis NBRC 104589 TaxID=1219064 RepID=A0A511QEZ5_9VIBR|nr:AsmA family protein [Vibrio sagamiensis NBRC 104589]